jgi:23S rRNA (adenine2503-C2)-methyltransferase
LLLQLLCISYIVCLLTAPYLFVHVPQVTVSTVGLVDVLERFAASSNVQLALSLHATTDEVRDWIVPVNRRHNLAALTAVLRQHYGSGNAAGRRVLVEYTMLSGVNDTLEDAARLVQLLEGVDAKVGGGLIQCFASERVAYKQ